MALPIMFFTYACSVPSQIFCRYTFKWSIDSVTDVDIVFCIHSKKKKHLGHKIMVILCYLLLALMAAKVCSFKGKTIIPLNLLMSSHS